MRSKTALKAAIVFAVLSAIGSALALWKGVSALSIGAELLLPWVLAVIFLLPPMVELFPARVKAIAVGVALVSVGFGGLSIYRDSTEHVALSLGLIGSCWWSAANLLTERGYLRHKSLGGIYQEFKAGRVKPPSPLAKTLERGSIALMLASIVCLFTITTW